MYRVYRQVYCLIMYRVIRRHCMQVPATKHPTPNRSPPPPPVLSPQNPPLPSPSSASPSLPSRASASTTSGERRTATKTGGDARCTAGNLPRHRLNDQTPLTTGASSPCCLGVEGSSPCYPLD
uniref:Uncharacterized protein n=1 Tax=Cacopsylla melanoneura TaxID=428564 RepID=A0A8D9ANZ9_9HEMI